MSFVTAVPTEQEITEFHLANLRQHALQTWTVDKSIPAFLILKQQRHDPLYRTREDFYFHFLGQTVIASFGLELGHEGDVLVFRWYLLGSYGTVGFSSGQQAVVLVDEDGRYADTRVIGGHGEPPRHHGYSRQDILEKLKEAFISYRKHYGFSENSSQKIVVDESRILPTEEDADLRILPDGRVVRTAGKS